MSENMKKTPLILMIFILILAVLACGLPSFSQAEETQQNGLAPGGQPSVDNSGGTRVYSDNGVEITLPKTYILGDVDAGLAVLDKDLRAMSEQAAGDILLWAYDTVNSSNQQTGLAVMKNENFAGIPLAIISPFASALLGKEVDIINQKRLTLGDREALQFLTATDNAGIVTNQVIYLFKDSGKLWIIGFLTSPDQIADRLPTFDTAVVSFSVLSVE